jgi:hypothetical protein
MQVETDRTEAEIGTAGAEIDRSQVETGRTEAEIESDKFAVLLQRRNLFVQRTTVGTKHCCVAVP